MKYFGELMIGFVIQLWIIFDNLIFLKREIEKLSN